MEKRTILISRRDAAAALGVSVDTVARLIANGELPTVMIGKSRLVSADAIDALVARGHAPTTQGRSS